VAHISEIGDTEDKGFLNLVQGHEINIWPLVSVTFGLKIIPVNDSYDTMRGQFVFAALEGDDHAFLESGGRGAYEDDISDPEGRRHTSATDRVKAIGGPRHNQNKNEKGDGDQNGYPEIIGDGFPRAPRWNGAASWPVIPSLGIL
jgi:hypothetical protein